MGRTTIICSWIFTVFAILAMGLMPPARRIQNRKLGLDDYMIIIAFVITLVLVAQTTWAILDEGQGNHVENETRTQLAMVASVRTHI